MVSYALNQHGMIQVERGHDGTASVAQALEIALDAGLQESAGLAYVNLHEGASRLNMFAEAERYYAEGMAYCEEHELSVYSVCMPGWRAVTFGLLGRWSEAADISARMLDQQSMSPVNRLNPLRVLGSVRGRRGEAGAWDLLDEALALAEAGAEALWITAVHAVRQGRGRDQPGSRSCSTLPPGSAGHDRAGGSDLGAEGRAGDSARRPRPAAGRRPPMARPGHGHQTSKHQTSRAAEPRHRSRNMALFMDFHDDLKLPAEGIAQIADDARAGRADRFGVRQVELYHNAEGQVYCLLEGPDEEAIRQHHAAWASRAGMCTGWRA